MVSKSHFTVSVEKISRNSIRISTKSMYSNKEQLLILECYQVFTPNEYKSAIFVQPYINSLKYVLINPFPCFTRKLCKNEENALIMARIK